MEGYGGEKYITMSTFSHIIFILFIALTACRKPYNAPVKDYEMNLLVVQGFINTRGVTSIDLSRTALLGDSIVVVESGAVVNIEGDDNSLYSLVEHNPGNYLSEANELSNAVKYRIFIRTSQGKSYRSDYRTIINTPPIDSITIARPAGNASLYINAYDPSGTTRYYKWNYEETWEIKSKYESFLVYHLDFTTLNIILSYYDPVGRGRNESIYRCWNDRISTGIKIGNTVKLKEDRVFYDIVSYRQGAEELSELYSILIRQQGLSKEGYEFYDKMKKNTESLGSIFDPMPSEIKGNIYSEDDPKEVVMGFIEATHVAERRFFISKDELPDWKYDTQCEFEQEVLLDNESLLSNIYYAGRLPTKYGDQSTVLAAKRECVDCTLKGSNIKPSFWP